MRTVSLLVALAVAGCAADPAKVDISTPPFDVTDEGKEDSPRRPSKGHDVRIAELREGTFTSSRGFIRHDIELTAGRVDIDLVGTEAGQPLDTILYVFGPRRANGTYPSKVIAFNDDMDPGFNVGSHVVLDVPTAGLYRIVVSTFDNYIYFPAHVSFGDYRLMVKCQDPAFGACGPAVSDVGGACWADSDCLAPDDSPLHCEGEVTCAPGTECIFVRIGTCVKDYAWMTYAPTQCSNPWSETHPDESQFPFPELSQVVKYYKQFGIEFDEIGVLGPSEPQVVCLACACGRGDEIVVKVGTPTAALLAEHGWIFSSSDPPAQSVAPKQCGSNPWQTSQADDVYAELELVDQWLDGEGAKVTKRGLSWPTEPQITCAACSCPRGDRLIAFGVDPHSQGLLSSLGFNDIYVP